MDLLGYTVRELASKSHSFATVATFKANEYIGAEFEMEGYRLPDPTVLKYMWAVKEDGSLRSMPSRVENGEVLNGTPWEYVLKRPVSPLVFSKRAFPYLANALKTNNAELHLSGRCSVHIHVGVHELRLYQVYAFMGLYYIFEDLIERLVGLSRPGNLFCLSLKQSPYMLDDLIASILKDGTPPAPANYKYTAVNLLTLYRLGTVEFRAMEGNVDPDRIRIWVNFLSCLRNFAKKLTPLEMSLLLNTMSLSGPSELMAQIFSEDVEVLDYLRESAIHLRKSMDSILYQGIGRVQPLFYEVDWARVVDHPYIEPGSFSADVKKFRTPAMFSSLLVNGAPTPGPTNPEDEDQDE